MPDETGSARLQPVSPQNAVLLIVDQQEALFSRIHQPEQTRSNLLALARCAPASRPRSARSLRNSVIRATVGSPIARGEVFGRRLPRPGSGPAAYRSMTGRGPIGARDLTDRALLDSNSGK